MTSATLYNLWVVSAVLFVIAIISCQAGCTASLRLPAVEYADREFSQPVSRPAYQITAEQAARADQRYEDYITRVEGEL